MGGPTACTAAPDSRSLPGSGEAAQRSPQQPPPAAAPPPTPTPPAEAANASPHPYVGMWVTADGHIRQELLANGRYDEARGDLESADPAAHTGLLPAWAPLLAYNSSKAALNMLTAVYAQSFPQISVVSVDPGFTATDLNGHQGTQSVAEGASAIVAAATAGPGTPSPAFVGATGPVPW
ncbi:Atu4866 domain-containing protein [Streptomyces radiopugnans]|uniref:Atu4866 domain-containing protein n=1 Tax=Streptomyces radiopugnans TaxID=403935 RepID=UPI003F1DEABD